LHIHGQNPNLEIRISKSSGCVRQRSSHTTPLDYYILLPNTNHKTHTNPSTPTYLHTWVSKYYIHLVENVPRHTSIAHWSVDIVLGGIIDLHLDTAFCLKERRPTRSADWSRGLGPRVPLLHWKSVTRIFVVSAYVFLWFPLSLTEQVVTSELISRLYERE
jgi:hypothetical protein